MLIDAAAAKALATIIFLSTQGAEGLNPQLPLETIDRGETWLVKGTPYTDAPRGMHFCFSHVMFRKSTAEVVSFGTDVRQILSAAEKDHWHKIMTLEEFDRIFGLRTVFEEGGPSLERNLLMNAAFNGGLINTPEAAIAYAQIIMNLSQRFAAVAPSTLHAEERDEVWHIVTLDRQDRRPTEVMSFSRINGKVLSGSL